MTTTHPDPTTLGAFALGRLPEEERIALEGHIAECAACGLALEGVGADSLLGLARQASQSTSDTAAMRGDDALPAPLVDHSRYQLHGRLGAGGMGVVYKAEHRMMGRTVALKVLNPQALARPGMVDRFRREVRLAAKLDHPNIVTAHDADEAGGLHFLVMEYVDGISLDRLVARRGPLPVPMACHFARQAALGLQHASGKGMVHRDIKPHNLVVTRKGVVKILDFGLAVLARGDDADAERMTAPEFVLGTPDFLAPEQARNAPDIDVRADLYALGGTLFYLLTGRPPFIGGNSFEKLLAHVESPPPDVRKLRPEVPAGLADLIHKMLAKKPSDRPQSAAEVASALLPFAKAGDAPIIEEAAETATIAKLQTPRETRRVRREPQRMRLAPYRWPLMGGLAVILFATLGIAIPKFWSPRQAAGVPVPATNGSPRALLVLPTHNLFYPDYGPLRAALEREGIIVTTASANSGAIARYRDTQGPPVTADLQLSAVDSDLYHAIVFVGMGVEEYLPGGKSEVEVRRIVDRLRGRKAVIAAICLGEKVLGDLGYLNARSAAHCQYYTSPKINWRAEPVVTDLPFVTAGSANDAERFARALAALARRAAEEK